MRGWIGIAVVAVLLLGLGGCLVGGYNRLVVTREAVRQSWAQVDNQLQRRNDLIGNLAKTVEGTAFQEQKVFGDIAAARAAMSGARTPEERTKAGQQMDAALGGSTLGRLLVVVENYPQLRSNEAFMGLMDELTGTENRLSVARQRYNQQVQSYNAMIKVFPTTLYAGMFRFTEMPYYEVPEAAKAVPRVDFGGLKK